MKEATNGPDGPAEEDEMSKDKPGMFARMRSLFRGIFGSWVRGKEQEKPEVIYEQAIAERVRQYRELKDAVAGILYMRNKIESEVSSSPRRTARRTSSCSRAISARRSAISLSILLRM